MKNQNKNFENRYLQASVQELMLFCIKSILKANETCTFERLVAECYTNFPKVFGFKRYPQWPDSLKLDRALRTLREKGYIVGGSGGKHSPGNIILTKFGEDIAVRCENFLYGDNSQQKLRHPQKSPTRSIDEKLIDYMLNHQLFKRFKNEEKKLTLSEPEFRNFLRCTMESSNRVIKQNFEYFKNVANLFGENKLLDFLEHCEKKFLNK